MSATNHVLRPVGMLEKLYTARQVLGIYNSVIVTATYKFQSKLSDTSLYSLFGATVSGLIHRHPSLCCTFEGERTLEPKFKGLRTIEVNDVLQIVDLEEGEGLAQKLQELHDQQWSVDEKPLWKLLVMKEERQIASEPSIGSELLYIAFVYHHVIGDGLSGAAFHRSLLRELRNVEHTGQDLQVPKAINTPVSINLIDPVEKLVTLPLSWLFLIKQAAQEYAPQWLTGAPSPLWAGLPVQTLDECPFRSRVRIISIEADKVQSLLKEGKKHNVTLTSLLTAAIVSSLAVALPEASRFVGMTPYTLRRVTGTSMDDMVNQTSSLVTSYVDDFLDCFRKHSNVRERVENFWNAATYFHAQMQDELERCPRDNLVGLLPYVVDYVKYYQKKIGKPREVTWELSNLGVFKTYPELLSESWKLENMTFTQGAQPVASAFSVNCASVQDGPLTIAITWQESIVHEGIIDALAHDFTTLPLLVQHERFR